MLTLTIQGNIIPLPVDFSMRLTWKSPVCDFEKIPSGYGLGMSFPINEYTRQLFGNPERFTKYRAGNDQKFPGFEVRFGGVLMAGTLSITSSSKDAYEATLIDQVGVLGEKEQERSILEFPEFAEEMAWENSANFSPDDSPYCCFPVKNPEFFKDKGMMDERVKQQLNETTGQMEDVNYDCEILRYVFDKTVDSTVNAPNPFGFGIWAKVGNISLTIDRTHKPQLKEYEAGDLTVVSPFFFLNHVIKTALKANNVHVGANFLETDANLRTLCIYNNFDITLNTFDVSFEGEPFEWTVNIYDDLFEGRTPPPFGEQTYKSMGKRIVAYKRDYSSPIKTRNHLPKMKLADVILSTQNLANCCFHFLPNNTVKVYSRDSIISGNTIDLNPYFLGTWAIGEKKKSALKFIWEPDNQDQVFGERFTDLSDRIADIKDPVANWTALQSLIGSVEGEIRFLTDDNVFAEYRWISQTAYDADTHKEQTTDVLGWQEISIGYQNGWFDYGREEVEEIKTSWSTLSGKYYDVVVAKRGLFAKQQGNMNSWLAKQQAFSPRLLLYNGNNTGSNENSDFALDWEKAGKGILPTYWKLWNPFWANRLPVTGDFDLPVNMLRHLIYNICSKYRTREGEFLIEEMSCDIFIDRIGTTEIKGFKVE